MTTQAPENTQTAPVAANNGAMVQPASEPAKPIVAQVTSMVQGYLSKGTLHLPADYSVDNAIKQAWLYLCEAVDKDKRPLLQVCTRESVVNAILDYVIQGMNVAKKQGYFIAYGTKCTFQRSYFGDQALAQRVKPGIQIYWGIVRDGDEFEFENIRGRIVVSKHKQSFANLKNPIIGAYCCILAADGEDLGAEVMTIDRIKKSWGMSKTYKPDAKFGTHHDFEDEMVLRTVIRKRCKPIINASSDVELLRSITRQDMESAEGAMDEEVLASANGEVIDIEEANQPALEAPASEPVSESAPVNSVQRTLVEEDPGY